ncbi:MAG: asparagine synthase (glutamine-hydrolyzing) [Candidatus Bathyarchaeia archaeon]
MSGVCVVLGPNAEELVKKLCRGLRHRGPDDEGFFIDGNLAMGHRALKMTSIPVPHQPLSNEDQTVWITFDGEIYNEKPLRERLSKNHTFNTNSSAEVVVHAYEEYGFECLGKFNGMFAFCLWDSKKRQLFSARDRLGMKPLYYYNCEGRFIFASEIKGILANSWIPRRPNKRCIYEYLVSGYPNQIGDTFFEGIKELMPAHYMAIDKEGVRIRRYWKTTQYFRSTVQNKDDSWCASEFRKLLRDSISIRLPTGLPVGTFLSGGLDSTFIAFLTHEILMSRCSISTECGGPEELFSAVYKEPLPRLYDERSYIKEVERALNMNVNYVFPSVSGQWDDIKRFIFCLEEPVAVFNYYVFWRLFQATKQKVKVVFSGQGCDAILGGQPEHVLIYFRELLGKKEIGRLLNELVKSSDWILLHLAYSLVFGRNAESKAKMLLGEQFVTAYGQVPAREEYSSLENALVGDVTRHAVEYLRVDDRASSTFSIECRHPFLDHRLIEFVFSLPPTQKIRNGWTKYVMRGAMKGFVPEAVRRKRRKSGTPIPQQHWMRELEGKIREIFESSKFRKRGYYNQPVVLEVFGRYCRGRLSRLEREYYTDVLWRILNLELWLEMFFDPESEIDVAGSHGRIAEEL